MSKSPYHYTECGLDNVWVAGIAPQVDDAGEDSYTISNLPGLHKEIAKMIVQSSGMSGKELRFLRTELGYTQDALAEFLHTKPLTISRWERNENKIDQNAITVIRLLVIEKLKLDKHPDVETLSKLSIAKAGGSVIEIDGSDPSNYRPMAA